MRFFVSITNEGPSPLSGIYLSFDVPPTEPDASRSDLVISDYDEPNKVAEFRFRNRAVTRANPLPPGEVAWTKQLNKVPEGTTLDVISYSHDGNGITENPRPSPLVEPDVTVHKFDFAHSAVPGGRLAGTFRFVTRR